MRQIPRSIERISSSYSNQAVVSTCWSLYWEQHMHAHTHTHNRFTALWILSVCVLHSVTSTWHTSFRVSRYQKKPSSTHNYRPLSASSIYYHPWHPPCSIYVPDSHFPKSPSFLSSTSWRGTIHFISPPYHCLLFADCQRWYCWRHCAEHRNTPTLSPQAAVRHIQWTRNIIRGRRT